MSFYIQVAGKPADVIRHIQDQPGHGDTSQIDAVKAFVCSELGAMPDPVNGVYVKANGHHDSRTRTLNIEIRHIELAEAEPPAA